MALADFEEIPQGMQLMSARDRRTRVLEITGVMLFAVALLIIVFITR